MNLRLMVPGRLLELQAGVFRHRGANLKDDKCSWFGQDQSASRGVTFLHSLAFHQPIHKKRLKNAETESAIKSGIVEFTGQQLAN